jgi:hypothetical protein
MLELLQPLLEAFAPLLKKRDTYYVILIAILAIVIFFGQAKLKADETALAARPKVEIKTEQQVKTVRVAGPVRIESKEVKGPGDTVFIDRIIERGETTTTTQKDTQVDKTIAPACVAAAPAPWRYAGVMVDPLSSTKLVGARGGVTLWNRLDLGGSLRLDRGAQGAVEASVRF